jgi:hypothetical protein
MAGMREKLATGFLLKVFWNEDASGVKTAVFPMLLQFVCTVLQQLDGCLKIHNSYTVCCIGECK